MKTITAGSWKGSLGYGLAPRELEATLYAASDMTAKEIARVMGIAPSTVSKRLEAARFKLGCRTVRGLVIEAFKRKIISPLTLPAHPPRVSPRHQQTPTTHRFESSSGREMRVTNDRNAEIWAA